MTEFTILVEAEDEDPRVDVFLDAVRSSLDALRELDSAISMRRRGTLQWVIGALHKGSPATMTIRAVPVSEDRDFSAEIVSTFLDGLESLMHGKELPPMFSDDALEAVKRLGRLSSDGIRRLRLQGDSRGVDISEQVSVNVDELIGDTFRSLGSIEGKLEMVTFHSQTYLRVYDATHGLGVQCFFSREITDVVRQALDKRVSISGTLRADRNGRPLSMRVQDIRIFPDEQELPKPSQLRGLAKGMTEGQRAEEYLRELRDDDR